jgi:hypothetical protein
MEQTRRLLRTRDLLEVYTATRLPYHWLRKFSAGAYANPSVNRVQFLYEHLTGTKLL